MYFTLTQHDKDCATNPAPTRLIDSAYTKLSQYVTPDGTKKTVSIPTADFAKNLLGQPFDFVHLKDFTIVNLVQNGTDLRMSNFLLKGNCGTNTGGTASSASSSTTGRTATATGGASNAGWAASPALDLLGLMAMAIV
jgi:hypothetical protein